MTKMMMVLVIVNLDDNDLGRKTVTLCSFGPMSFSTSSWNGVFKFNHHHSPLRWCIVTVQAYHYHYHNVVFHEQLEWWFIITIPVYCITVQAHHYRYEDHQNNPR